LVLILHRIRPPGRRDVDLSRFPAAVDFSRFPADSLRLFVGILHRNGRVEMRWMDRSTKCDGSIGEMR
jgi:hypothetical protein